MVTTHQELEMEYPETHTEHVVAVAYIEQLAIVATHVLPKRVWPEGQLLQLFMFSSNNPQK